MTVRNLEFLFRPESVAVIVDTEYPGEYAEILLRNLNAGAFTGPLMQVAVHKRSRFKIGARVRLDKMEVVPDST